jgi:ABC-type branched-subunit amino acid transport system substrate-binding protein
MQAASPGFFTRNLRGDNMRLNKRQWMGSAVAALLAAAAPWAAHAGGVSDKEIVIGTHMDLSGPVAAGMPQLRNGTQMRFDEVNEAGGIHGRRIRFIVEDNASQPQQAVRAVDKLIRKDDVFAMVNPFGSGTNAAVVKRAVDEGVIYFAPWAASAVLQQIAGKSPRLFTTVPDYHTTTHLGLTWLLDQNPNFKKVGWVYMEGPFGDLIGRGVKSAMAAKNMTLAAEASYKPGEIDFSSQVARMRAAGVDLIVMATITRETVGMMTEIKKIGWNNVAVLTGNPGRTSIVSKLGKDAIEGLYGVGTWKILDAATATADKAWVDSYKKRFNLDPDENAFLAYAYADWFVKGLQAAGRNLTTDSAVKALQATSSNHPVFLGPASFKNNHFDPELVTVDQARGGTWRPVSPVLK